MSVGVHVAKKSHVLDAPNKDRKTMIDAIKKDCEKLQLKCCQIFVQGPMNTKMNNIEEKEIKQYCDENKINLYVHSSYMTVGCWNITEENKSTTKSKFMIESIKKQMKKCDEINSKGFVVHLSKKTPSQIINALKIIYPRIKDFRTPFLFEQPA